MWIVNLGTYPRLIFYLGNNSLAKQSQSKLMKCTWRILSRPLGWKLLFPRSRISFFLAHCAYMVHIKLCLIKLSQTNWHKTWVQEAYCGPNRPHPELSLYGGPDSSIHCNLSKLMKTDKTRANEGNIFINAYFAKCKYIAKYRILLKIQKTQPNVKIMFIWKAAEGLHSLPRHTCLAWFLVSPNLRKRRWWLNS